MSCICGIEECKVQQNSSINRQKLTVTLDNSVKLEEIVHMLIKGVRILNVDLSYGTYSDHLFLIHNVDKAIEMYQENTEFNIPITKVCTIKGKSLIVGRMRNDCMWTIEAGDLITLTSDQRYETCSTNQVCYISNFENHIPLLKTCEIIQVGKKMKLQVIKIVGCNVTCCVFNSGVLKSYQKLYCLQIKYELEKAVEQEINDCIFAVNYKFDFIIVPDVKRPEYFHVIEKLIRESDIKLIAKIHNNLESKVVEKIFEHFYAVYFDNVNGIDLEHLSKLAVKLKKPLLAEFPNCLNRKAIHTCEIADCFMLKVKNSSTLSNALKKLKKITANIEKYAEQNELCDKDEFNYDYSNSATNQAKKLLSKAIICITKTGETVKDVIKHLESRYLIALTKDDKIAKRLQLWRNVVPMIYVDCSEKSWKDQDIEMTQIGMKFLFDGKIINDENCVTVRYDE